MSRSSNQKRKRKTRRATGVPETVYARAMRRWQRTKAEMVLMTAPDGSLELVEPALITQLPGYSIAITDVRWSH